MLSETRLAKLPGVTQGGIVLAHFPGKEKAITKRATASPRSDRFHPSGTKDALVGYAFLESHKAVEMWTFWDQDVVIRIH